jgi:hypothetical protein
VNKHVCAACETIYAIRSGLYIEGTEDDLPAVEAWHCDSCGRSFVELGEIERLFRLWGSMHNIEFPALVIK